MALFLALATSAHAAKFDVPGGDLTAALNAYSAQSGVYLMVSTDAIRGIKTEGVKGELPSEVALARILKGTGLCAVAGSGGRGFHRPREAVGGRASRSELVQVRRRCAWLSAAAAASVETVVVTSSKIKGDIQTVPIAITALSQEQLTSRQIAGGPDLVKEVPNLTFSKTNFTGYNIQIRGIGTQAISVTTDPAVAVAFNDTPFIRNHFFEQEFYDVQSGRSVARAARHALWPQRHGRRGERHFGEADRPVRSHAVGRLGQLSQSPLRRHGQYPHRRTTASICAWRANGRSATATASTKPPASPSTAAICGPPASRLRWKPVAKCHS